jgi:Rad51 protein
MTATEVLNQPRTTLTPASKDLKVKYATGLSLLGLTSGLPQVDALIGGLKPGTIALLTGPEVCLQAAERYCVRAQLPENRGGLDGSAYFIDGGNSFDIYLFTALVRKHHLGYDAALDRQLLSRAFTIYELWSLVEDSETVFMTRRPKLLVVSEVFSLFTEDIDRYEARRVFRNIASSISDLGKRQQVPILLTSVKRHELTAVLEEHCSVSLDITEEKEDATRFRLFKHPWKAPVDVVTQARPRNYNQDTLQLEAAPHG